MQKDPNDIDQNLSETIDKNSAESVIQTKDEPAQKPNKNKLIVILVIAFLVLLAIFIVVFIWLRRSDSSKVDNTNSTQTESVVQPSSINTAALPLGDGKYTSAPKQGYIYACQTSFNGGGAFTEGPWINSTNKTYNLNEKPSVTGNIPWNNATVQFSTSGANRIITGNALPINHNTGIFPIPSSDVAYQYDRNPNKIGAQTVSLTLPINPTVSSTPSCVGGEVGIATSGVPIFSGFDAGGRDAVAHEVQDKCDGHPQNTSIYHYHSLSDCIDSAQNENGYAKLIGYSLDGFGMFGPQESGKTLVTSDLDECHGHSGKIIWEGQEVEMYHYHATADFPYTLGCFKAKASARQVVPAR